MAENDAVSSSKPPAAPQRPTIALPPRGSMEALFGSGGFGASPGPMTLVSSFFSDSDADSDCRSFSQLLAGAMASPSSGDGADLRFKQSRPPGLVVTQAQLFTIPPGLSPASLLESPGLFPSQGSFGMSHQQALAHVTARAQPQTQHHQHQHQPSMYMLQGNLPTSLTMNTSSVSMTGFPSMQQELLPPGMDSRGIRSRDQEQPHFPNLDERPQPSSVVVDKPADDGFNWRKYGQKQVKGSEFPRSYYKCTHPSCPVKKLVERSVDGQVTEIIYKGQHNHAPPQSNKRGKETSNVNGSLSLQSQIENAGRFNDGLAFSLGRREPESSHGAGECLSSSEDVGDDGDDGEPDAKRRSLEGGVSEPAGANHRTVTEPRIIVQTTSEVDLLDDGYRWRKYGQKVVKGNPYPRSYYKCTFQGCNVRKHIERASSDPKAVITTYEGKHTHEVPAPRASSHNTAPSNAPQPPTRPFAISNQHQNQSIFLGRQEFSNDNHQPVAFLQLKEERIS